jgi:putative tryptophan/tyrosine transport system substrate-binding protein
MNRRAFITALGGAAAWPLAGNAQPGAHTRRLGILMGLVEGDQAGQTELAAFMEHFDQLGWIDGLNIKIDCRWPGTDSGRIAAAAKDLLRSVPMY